jgi:hypothetical protein
MSLSLLLDEHISAAVATQVQARRPEVSIQSIYDWRGGSFAGEDDDPLLAAAAGEGLTLVTYDQKTIPSLLTEFALQDRSHGGVVFVDDRTIASSDIGSLVLATLALWDQGQAWDWTNRVVFLRRAGEERSVLESALSPNGFV